MDLVVTWGVNLDTILILKAGTIQYFTISSNTAMIWYDMISIHKATNYQILI